MMMKDEQQPAAWIYDGPDGQHYVKEHRDVAHQQLIGWGWTETPLYTHPLSEQTLGGGETSHFQLEWVGAPRPPVHPTPMTGRQSFPSFDAAIAFMGRRPADSSFVSLTEILTHSVNRTSDAILALKTKGQGDAD
jgi:hypothetical protein